MKKKTYQKQLQCLDLDHLNLLLRIISKELSGWGNILPLDYS